MGMPRLGKLLSMFPSYKRVLLPWASCRVHTNIPENTKDIERPGPGGGPPGGRMGVHQQPPMGSRFPPPDPRGRPMPLLPDRPITARGYHPPHAPPPGHPPQHGHPPRSKMGPPMEEFYARGGRPPRPGRPTEVRHRLFVALFDYDPQSMSPNPDACEEELPFREGQTIKVGDPFMLNR